MALKIVHLCDVHATKGEDIPASFAHTIAVDGGTFAIDLCPVCDQERFTPLVAFLEAFALLTDGVVDPREAVAENLRTLYAAERFTATEKFTRTTPAAREKRRKEEVAPSVPAPSPERSETQPVAQESAESIAAGKKLQKETRARLPLVRTMLVESPEGLSVREVAQRLDTRDSAALNALQLLASEGRSEYIAGRWWAPENVPAEERERLRALREIVAARNSVPRVCPVEGESFTGTSAWQIHVRTAHGVEPAEMLGLFCPIDGEEFSAPQVLGMHGRKEHDAVHTPQLFEKAEALGDALGVIADIRARYAREQTA